MGIPTSSTKHYKSLTITRLSGFFFQNTLHENDTMNTYKIIIRTDVQRKDGTAALALQVFIEGQRKVIALGVAVQPAQFDKVKQVVKMPDKGTGDKVNALIEQAKRKAQHIILDALLAGRTLNVTTFTELYTGARNQGDFLAYFEKWVAAEQGIKADNTLKAYRVAIKNVREFQKEVRFGDLTPEWVERFDKHLHRRKFDVNYVTKTHKLVQACINAAIRGKKIAENPYRDFRFKHAKTERDFLNMTELQRLIDLYQANTLRADEQEVLRYFLFAAVAGGLRLGDVKELRWDEIVGEWLVFRPEKTAKSRTVLKVPLSKVALSIIQAVPRQGEKVFRCKADAVTNRLLKAIARAAKIDKTITFHVSRHTFASVYLAMGGSVHVLQKIMGHGKIDTTMIYVHTQNEQKITDMARFDAAFGEISAIEAKT